MLRVLYSSCKVQAFVHGTLLPCGLSDLRRRSDSITFLISNKALVSRQQRGPSSLPQFLISTSTQYRYPSPMRYRPSNRALRRSSRPSLRSPHQQSRSGKGYITRQVDFHQELVSPRRLADTSGQLPVTANRSGRPGTAAGMISARSLSTASSTVYEADSTACELGDNDPVTEDMDEPFVPPLLPPFQQSKRWPGRRKPVPQRSKDQEVAHDDIHVQVQPATPDAAVEKEQEAPYDNLAVQHATSDVASTSVPDDNCGLPKSTALAGLRHRQSVQASLAWQRWKNRRSTDRQLECISSEPVERISKSTRIRRRLSRSLRAMTRTRTSRTTGRVRHFVLFSRRLGSISTSPPATDITSPKNMAARLSRSLIPDGDTCEFEQEMNKEYPKIKEKHFGRYVKASPKKCKEQNPAGDVEVAPLENSPPVPRKSVDIIEWKQQQTIRPVTDQNGSPVLRVDETKIDPQEARAMSTKPTRCPPPRTSSRIATDPDLLSGPSEASVVSMTRLAPALRSARSLRSKPGSGNLRSRTRKRSFGLPASPSPRVRAAASTDTLATIEAQAGIDDTLSAEANSASPTRSLLALKASQSPGKPPERPLPDLPFEPQHLRRGTASRTSQRSLRSSKDSAVTEAYQSMVLNAEGRSSPADELTPLPLARYIRQSPRRHSKRQSTNSAKGKIPIYPDPPSPTSIYSHDSQLSVQNFAQPIRTNSVGRNKHVRALKSRDLRLANQASISEEDEENFTDIAEKFPPAPASRGSSRSRKGHIRDHSAGLSLRSRRRNAVQQRPAVPEQTLALSRIMTIVNTDPVTDTFRTASPAPDVHSEVTVAKIDHLVGARSSKTGLRSGRQTPVGGPGTNFPRLKPPLVPQTPPLTASSSDDADAEIEDFPEDEILPPTRTVTGTSIRQPHQSTLLSQNNISAKRQPLLPSSSSAPNLTLSHRPTTSSSSSLFSSSRVTRNHSLAHNHSSRPSNTTLPASHISDLLTRIHALERENETLRQSHRNHQHLERKLTQIEQARYRQGNEEDRRLQRSYEERGRERLLPPATAVGAYSRPASQISAAPSSVRVGRAHDPFADHDHHVSGSGTERFSLATETAPGSAGVTLEDTTLEMDTWLNHVFDQPVQFLGNHELWAVPTQASAHTHVREVEPAPLGTAHRMSTLFPTRPPSSSGSLTRHRDSLLLPPNTYRPATAGIARNGLDLAGPKYHHDPYNHTTPESASINPRESSFLLNPETDFARIHARTDSVQERELPLALRAGPGAVERRLGAFVEG